MKGLDLYFENGSTLKVSLAIKEACSNNSVNKRKLSNIQLRIHDKKNPPMVFECDEWYLLPGNSKFVLKRKEAFKAGCFKGTKKIQVDLTQNYLNSIDGLYLNLENKQTLKIECSELAFN